MADYAAVQRGPMKLKGIGNISACKKMKKKDKERKSLKNQVASTSTNKERSNKCYVDERTPAQIAFDKMQEKRQMEKTLNKTCKSYKSRIEDFNSYLDKLSEYYDVPKVSWTK